MNSSVAYRTACNPPPQQGVRHVIQVSADQAYQTQEGYSRVPVRARGDLKWPPEPYRKRPGDGPPPLIETPRLRRKDYSGFFEQNALPDTTIAYKVAPGTCHITPEEGRYLPDHTSAF